MPTYDYLCNECKTTFEEFHGMTESPEIACPSCGSKKTQKLISAGAGLIFKGSGFYITDYKKNNGSDNGSTSHKRKSETQSDSSKQSQDKKPEAKPATQTE